MFSFESFAIGFIFALILTKSFDYSICESEVLSFSIFVLIGAIMYEVFLYLNSPPIPPKKKSVSFNDIPELKEFQPSETFSGRIEGYVFKNDIKGQGYYLDK